MKYFYTVLIGLLSSYTLSAQLIQKKVLMFVSHEQTYYSEYIICKTGLEDAGYQVEVRSVSSRNASAYMDPSNTTIDATANTLNNSTYSQFQAQYLNAFGKAWNENLNAIQASIPVAGSILDINSTLEYDAFVIPGGTGSIEYRYDGTYAAQGSGSREISSDSIELVAKKLNSLGIDFLRNGKPVLAQCHGAALPVYWRIPGTSGAGAETLGYSLLKDQNAAGFPDAATASLYNPLSVTHRSNDPVVVSPTYSGYIERKAGAYKIITSRDWYPQTVAHATRTLLNVLETYGGALSSISEVKVLILHGGQLDSTNCHYTNLANDIPCNHSGVQPADYRDLLILFDSNSANDDFNYQVNHLNIANSSLPYDSASAISFYNYVKDYDVVLFYKHWATHVRAEMIQGLKNYVDNGGGLVALHHGLYSRDEAGGASKQELVNLFGASSENSGFGISLTNYTMFSSNYGHFVSTYGINYAAGMNQPAWSGNPINGINRSLSQLPNFSINDELYTNMNYIGGVTFGYDVGQITPLFSNSNMSEPNNHASGFVRRMNDNQDSLEGRMVYFQPGERKENYLVSSVYGQLIRNAVYWSADLPEAKNPGFAFKPKPELEMLVYPNPSNSIMNIDFAKEGQYQIQLYNTLGILYWTEVSHSSSTSIDLSELPVGVYFVRVENEKGIQGIQRIVKQ